MLAALGIFAVVTLGIVPLLGSALKASSTSSARTVAQEAARNIMERIQGTKWYVSYDAKPNKRVDILDLYYPQAASNTAMGQSFQANASNAPLVGTGGVFTTTCSPAPATANPACNFPFPDGYTLTIETSFIKKLGTSPETYQIVTPCTAMPCTAPYTAPYAWNSQGNDVPAQPLMDVDVIVGWTQHGKARSYSLRAILGDRKFAATAAVDAGPSPSASAPSVTTGLAKIHGNAVIDYVVQAQTGYSNSTAQPSTGCPVAPCKSEGTYTFGISESTINAEDTASTADQSSKIADFRIVRTYTSSQAPPATPPPDLANVQGAAAVAHAPPNSFTGFAASMLPTQPITHPELNAVQAVVYGGEIKNVKVDVSNELPQAEGEFKTYGLTNGQQEATFTNSQIDYASLRLEPTQPLGFFNKVTSFSPPGIGSYTKANSYALTAANRSVETKAFSGFNQFALLRFRNSNRQWTMFNVTAATANVNCKSTANPATASATATWSMNWVVNYDPTNNSGSPSSPSTVIGTFGSNQAADTYNGSPNADSLAQLKALNPLEYDDANNANDIYLFEKRDPVTGNITQKGYISDFEIQRNPPTSVSADGRSTSASVDGALRIGTASLNPLNSDTQTTMSFLKTSCEAVDNR